MNGKIYNSAALLFIEKLSVCIGIKYKMISLANLIVYDFFMVRRILNLK